MNPFEDYKVYGPIYHKRIDRYMIFLVSPEHRTSMTYARFLMCLKEGRWLTKDEEVDHIDGNRLNDDLSNLQILTKAENTRKSAATGKTMIQLNCGYCGSEFERERRLVVHVKNRKLPPCCSRSCSAKLQLGGISQMVREAHS